MYPQKKTSKAFTTIYFVNIQSRCCGSVFQQRDRGRRTAVSWGQGWGEELAKARVCLCLCLLGDSPNNRHGLWRAQGLGPLWLTSRSLNPNFLQLGMLLPCSHVPAAQINSYQRPNLAVCNPQWRHPGSNQGSCAGVTRYICKPDGASLPQVGSLAWGLSSWPRGSP